jgi:hypothetical protein
VYVVRDREATRAQKSSLGNLPKMRWGRKDKSTLPHQGCWHKWFAWHPVWIDKEWIWLENVQRMGYWQDDIAGLDAFGNEFYGSAKLEYKHRGCYGEAKK